MPHQIERPPSPRRLLAALATGLALLAPVTGAAWAGDAGADDLVIRKNVTALSARERADFVDAIWRLRRTPSPEGEDVGNWYDHFVASHMRKLVCWTDEPGQGGFGHNGPDLLTWHRQYLLEFEAAMSTVMGKPMAIPYWDWTDPDSIEMVFADDFMGPAGDPDNGYMVMSGPFRRGEWRLNVKGFESTNPGQFDWLVRAMGISADHITLPRRDEVQQALLRPRYDDAPWGVVTSMDKSFRAFVDGMISATGTTCNGGAISVQDVTGTLLHGTVHLWVGGTTPEGNPGSLADTVTSPNDPVFWLHHANIDRLAETWWAAHDYQYLPITGGPRGSNLTDRMWPYLVTHADVAVPTAQLGYRYDVPVAIVPDTPFVTAEEWLARRGYSGAHSH